MFCNACGKVISDDARFCAYCGTGIGHPLPLRKLMRLRTDRKIAGICAGLERYLGLDVIVVRLIWVFVTLLSGIVPGIVVYLVAWIIVPEEPMSQTLAATSQPATPVASGG